MWVPMNASYTGLVHNHLFFNETNIVFGTITLMVNVLLLIVLLISPVLREKSEMLVVLCIADGINCLSIALMGLSRSLLFSRVMDTLSVPVRTGWQCATEPWLVFRVYGSLWPPITQMAMAVDRVTAVFYPVRYNNHFSKRRRGVFFVSTFVVVTLTMSVGYVLAFSRRAMKVKYWCGRKAAFGNVYASSIYITTISGYVFSFMITTISYFKSKFWMKDSSGQKQLTKIRYQIFLSMFSVILISIPNGIGLFAQYIGKVGILVVKPSTYLACINSSLSIFIYLALYAEFRSEFIRLLRMLICWSRNDNRWGTRLSTSSRLAATSEVMKFSTPSGMFKHSRARQE